MRKGSGRGEHGLNKRRLGAEGGQVGIQRRGAAGVEEQHVGALGEVSLAGQIDKAGHGLAGVDGVEQDAFRAASILTASTMASVGRE